MDFIKTSLRKEMNTEPSIPSIREIDWHKIALIIYRWYCPSITEYCHHLERLVNGLTLKNNPIMIVAVRTVFCYLFLSTFKYLLIYFLPLTHYQRILFSDMSIVFGFNGMMNFFVAWIMLAMSYIYRSFYLSDCFILHKILVDIVERNDHRFFLGPWLVIKSPPPSFELFRHPNDKNRFKRNPSSTSEQRINVCQFIRKGLTLLVWTRNLYLNMLNLCIIYFQFFVMKELIWEWKYFLKGNQIFLCFKIIMMEFNGLLLYIDFLLLIHILFTLFISFMGSSWMIFLKYTQIAQELNHVTLKKIDDFRHNHCRLFIFLDSVVKEYSGLFLLFILAIMPCNVFCVSSYIQLYIAQEHRKYWVQSNLLIFASCGHLMGLMGVHLVGARYNKYIHMRSGIPKLLSFDARLRMPDFYSHLKMCHYIQQFHTKKQYGYTYGKFGLMSMGSFFKFILTYFKGLRMAYKLL